ncbi:hypothetical protein RUM43_002243 [Polyplax serrata]|uniref:Uncharacterized protein n=1 Tax=Polyplax serrata TaxID=468196 RepID=A0AAN8NYJ1_POLSC
MGDNRYIKTEPWDQKELRNDGRQRNRKWYVDEWHGTRNRLDINTGPEFRQVGARKKTNKRSKIIGTPDCGGLVSHYECGAIEVQQTERENLSVCWHSHSLNGLTSRTGISVVFIAVVNLELTRCEMNTLLKALILIQQLKKVTETDRDRREKEAYDEVQKFDV